jgi:hypothetical protein
MAFKGAVCADLGKDGKSCKGVLGFEPGSMGEKSCVLVIGMQWGMKKQR